MVFRSQKRIALIRPRRLVLAALLPVALVWAAGAALPGIRGDLAALAPATAGTLPRAAPVTAVRLTRGVVLIAPQAGRFQPAVTDGTPVARGVRVADIDGPGAAVLSGVASAASRALASGGMTSRQRVLLTTRAATARSLAAGDRAGVVVPVAGTVRWRIPAPEGGEPAPSPGQWVTAGQRLGVVASPVATVWRVRTAARGISGLQPGTQVELVPLGLTGRVTRLAGAGTADVVAGPTAAGADGRPLAMTVTWGRVRGALVPASALVRRGAAVWVLAGRRFGGRLRWMRVSVAAEDGGRAAVAGLAPGSWVAARPWLAGLWAVWPWGGRP